MAKDGIKIEKTIDRNKHHQFVKNYRQLPAMIRNMFEEHTQTYHVYIHVQ